MCGFQIMWLEVDRKNIKQFPAPVTPNFNHILPPSLWKHDPIDIEIWVKVHQKVYIIWKHCSK